MVSPDSRCFHFVEKADARTDSSRMETSGDKIELVPLSVLGSCPSIKKGVSTGVSFLVDEESKKLYISYN